MCLVQHQLILGQLSKTDSDMSVFARQLCQRCKARHGMLYEVAVLWMWPPVKYPGLFEMQTSVRMKGRQAFMSQSFSISPAIWRPGDLTDCC